MAYWGKDRPNKYYRGDMVELASWGVMLYWEIFALECKRVEFNFASSNCIPNAQLLFPPPRTILLVFDIFVFVDPVCGQVVLASYLKNVWVGMQIRISLCSRLSVLIVRPSLGASTLRRHVWVWQGDEMGWAGEGAKSSESRKKKKKKGGINWAGTWLRSFPTGIQELPMNDD